jgi:hypothetical protein
MNGRSSLPKNVLRFGLAASHSVEEDVVSEARRNFPAAAIFKASKKAGFSKLDFRKIA